MWHWDQGHLEYFQFDAIKRIAEFVLHNDFKTASKSQVSAFVGLPFAAPFSHGPWRQYSRTLKRCLLVSEVDGQALATPVASVLSKPGAVTCDEYFLFLVRSFTEPSPSMKAWGPKSNFRYPLLFCLKYLLAKVSIGIETYATFDELIGAFAKTNFVGDEDDLHFIDALSDRASYVGIAASVSGDLRRQARESLKVMSQLSFLQVRSGRIEMSLAPEDAKVIFDDAAPIIGLFAEDRESEIRRLAELFRDGSTSDVFDYPNTVVSDVVESGFTEGTKVKKTHLVIERNASLRREFFAINSSAICDVCTIDTKKSYPWTNRVLDIHHLLPLSSGTRVEMNGTTFNDLVPVCPTCHRAVHRYYDSYLASKNQLDFTGREEAKSVYKKIKVDFGGVHFA